MAEIVEKFGLEWHLIVAQMVNFAILFAVLYRFVYKPVLSVLDKRREKIEGSLKQAKEIEEKNRKLQEEIAEKLAVGKKEAEKIIAEAKEIGESARNNILLETNREVSSMLTKAKKDMEYEKERMMSDIQDYIVKMSLAVVEKLLTDKLDEKTKTCLVDDSIKELSLTK